MEDDPAAAGRRSLAGGAVRAAYGQLATAAAGALTTVLAARLLGVSELGSFALAQTLLLMLLALGTLGLEQGISYGVASGAWAARTAYTQTQLVGANIGIAAAFAGLAARVACPSAFQGLSILLTEATLVALPFALSWLYASYLALALDRYEVYAYAPALQAVLSTAGVAGLGAAFGLDGAVAALPLSHALTALVIGLRTARIAPPGKDSDSGAAFRRALRFGLNAYAANALTFLSYRLDMFLLSAAATRADVGRYAVAVTATSALWLVPRALSGVVLPRVAALDAGAQAERRDAVEQRSVRHVALVVWASAAALALGMVLLIPPVFGSGFRPAIGLGLILLPGAAAVAIAGAAAATVVGRGQPRYSLRTALISTPVAIVLYAALIPPLEATGAALGSTIAYCLSLAVLSVYYRRVTGRSLWPLLLPTRAEIGDLRRLIRARVAAS